MLWKGLLVMRGSVADQWWVGWAGLKYCCVLSCAAAASCSETVPWAAGHERARLCAGQSGSVYDRVAGAAATMLLTGLTVHGGEAAASARRTAAASRFSAPRRRNRAALGRVLYHSSRGPSTCAARGRRITHPCAMQLRGIGRQQCAGWYSACAASGGPANHALFPARVPAFLRRNIIKLEVYTLWRALAVQQVCAVPCRAVRPSRPVQCPGPRIAVRNRQQRGRCHKGRSQQCGDVRLQSASFKL